MVDQAEFVDKDNPAVGPRLNRAEIAGVPHLPTLARALVTAIEIYAGDRLETLAGQLADEIRRNPLDPFEPERFVVPHSIVGRRLVLALAKELGNAANVSI